MTKKKAASPTLAPTAVPPDGFFTDADGFKIHYRTFGEGAPLVLVHSLFGSIKGDWLDTGLVDVLQPGHRLIALDHRGHGDSDKPLSPSDYRVEKMGQDVLSLMDYVGVQKAKIFGYSMGSFISSWVLINHQERLESVVLGGTGSNLQPNDPTLAKNIYDALMAEDPATVQDPVGKLLRSAFDAAGADRNSREACAACTIQFLPLEQHYQASDFAGVKIPVLIIDGEQDFAGEGVQALADAILGSKLVIVPGPNTDHLSVRTDPLFKQTVVDFLKS